MPKSFVCALGQIDTPGKGILLFIAVFYVFIVLLVPTANVFVSVRLNLGILHLCFAFNLCLTVQA